MCRDNIFASGSIIPALFRVTSVSLGRNPAPEVAVINNSNLISLFAIIIYIIKISYKNNVH